MATYDYDLVIIGSGPGGYVAAIRAGQLGLKAAVIEKDKIGGVCLNIGCIPSKSLIHQAGIYRSLTTAESYGVKVDRGGFDYSKVYANSRKAADTLSRGVAYLLKKNNVTVLTGHGRLETDHEVSIDGQTRVSAANIIVATGSRPRQIPGFEFDETTVLSSTGTLLLQELPKSAIILGAGAIGVEFAHLMNAFGVGIHLVEMMDQILPLEDAEVSDVVRRSFTKRGMKVYTSTRALSLRKENGKAVAVLENAQKEQQELVADKVIVVVGRAPNTEDIGLEKLGIATERGYIAVGDYGETRIAGIYAIGDIVPTPLLAHVASKEGEIAVEHIAGHEPRTRRIDLLAIPGATYCEPQVGSFGLTEKQAIERKVQYQTSKFPCRGAGKSVAIDQTEGFVKMLFDPSTHEILGAHAVGADATEVIHELLLAKTAELLPVDIATMTHAHPTMSETVMEAARAVEGWAIHI